MAAFVKFSRGLKSAYTALQNKDPNTLYLVYDSQNSATGELYLGNKLISSASSSGGTPVALADLSDVSLEGVISDGAILQFNASTGGGIWEAADLNEILPIHYGNSLSDITSPRANDIAIVDGQVYIYHNNDWMPLGSTAASERLDELEDLVGHPSDEIEEIPASGLFGLLEENYYTKSETDDRIAELIAQVGHLKYQVVQDLDDIDTSEEGAEYIIYLVPKDESAVNDGYDEYLLIDGNLEKVGSWDVDPSTILSPEQQEKLEAITLDGNGDLLITSAQVGDFANAVATNSLIKDVQSGVFNVDSNGTLNLVGIPTTIFNPDNFVLKTTVGDLNALTQAGMRVSPNSTVVDELLAIKQSIVWNELSSN